MDVLLAFEVGGSRTRLGVYDSEETLLRQAESGPGNPFDVGVDLCLATMVELGRGTLKPTEQPLEVCAAVAGASLGSLQALAHGLCRHMRTTRASVTGDLYPILLANVGARDAVLAVAGTGSSVMAQRADGAFATVGGRGNLFVDRGSGYAIAAAALRAAAEAFDGLGPATELVTALPEAAGCSHFSGLVMWGRRVSKFDVAALCPVVAACADDDEVARRVLAVEAHAHADQALAGVRKLALGPDAPILCYGGVFDGSPAFFEFFKERIRQQGHQGDVARPAVVGHGAVLQIRHATSRLVTVATAASTNAPPTEAAEFSGVAKLASRSGDAEGAANRTDSPTEERLPSEVTLDAMGPEEIVAAMGQQDARAIEAVQEARVPLATLMDMAARAIQQGGRIIYVGAGTSGRLGALDASECPPTFGLAPGRVCAIIAGGDRALRDSSEGSEDDVDLGRRDIRALQAPVGPSDVVIGIAASGTTPYTRVALETAAAAGAKTALLCCNPHVTSGAGLIVALETGPEILAGSTRLKAGTATKLALNMISTGAMALSGYVYKGRMVGVKPSNEKLWRRASRIVADLLDCPPERADSLLRAADGRVAVAILMGTRDLTAQAAAQRLEEHGGHLRAALNDD